MDREQIKALLQRLTLENEHLLVDQVPDLLAAIDELSERAEAAEERERSCYAWAHAARTKKNGLPPSRALRWIDEMGQRIYQKKDLHERLEHHHTGGVVICSRGCCPGCSDCYGESIGCHQDPCVCK
jgi:hypothetical protein